MSGEKRNKTIGTRATETEYNGFNQLAASGGYDRPSEFLRLILSKVLPGVIEAGDQQGKERKHSTTFLRWSENENEEILIRAKREGTNRQGWIRRVVLAALRRKPQPTKDEEKALRESNRELVALGRNINQIAHKLNTSIREVDLVHAQMLEELAGQIEEHRQIVTDLLNANWRRVGEDENER